MIAATRLHQAAPVAALQRTVGLLGVPTRFGTAFPGSERTPDLLRGGIVDWLAEKCVLPVPFVDRGDVTVPMSDWSVDGFPLRCLEQVLIVAERQAAAVAGLVADGLAPLVVGGDCTTMLGTVAGLRRTGRTFGLVCFDAHGDFNTPETTPSGNVHGMTVAAVSGRGAPELLDLFGPVPGVLPERITLLGVRDLDPPEAVALAASPVVVVDPRQLRIQGAQASGELALRRAGDATEGILLHLDLDVLDPAVAPGVGLPVPGGLTLDELWATLEPLLASGRLLAVEVTEAAPALDPSGRTADVLAALLARIVPALAASG